MTSDVRDPPRGYPCWQSVLASENANFFLYKPCVMCLILLLSRLLQSGSEPGLSLSLSLSLWEWARGSLLSAKTWVSPTSLLLLNKTILIHTFGVWGKLQCEFPPKNADIHHAVFTQVILLKYSCWLSFWILVQLKKKTWLISSTVKPNHPIHPSENI